MRNHMKKSMKPVTALLVCVFGASLAVSSAQGAVRTNANAEPVVALSKSKLAPRSVAQLQSQRLRNSAKALNPQPLPPGPSDIGHSRLNDRARLKALNPQPLPPGPSDIRRSRVNAKALNPQPLPPGPDRGRAVLNTTKQIQSFQRQTINRNIAR